MSSLTLCDDRVCIDQILVMPPCCGCFLLIFWELFAFGGGMGVFARYIWFCVYLITVSPIAGTARILCGIYDWVCSSLISTCQARGLPDAASIISCLRRPAFLLFMLVFSWSFFLWFMLRVSCDWTLFFRFWHWDYLFQGAIFAITL